MIRTNALPIGVEGKKIGVGLQMVYESPFNGPFLVKVGIAKNVSTRISSIQTGNPYEIFIEAKVKVSNPAQIERDIHCLIAHYHIRGEWFYMGRKTMEEIRDIIINQGR